jgi:hypothetical protein
MLDFTTLRCERLRTRLVRKIGEALNQFSVGLPSQLFRKIDNGQFVALLSDRLSPRIWHPCGQPQFAGERVLGLDFAGIPKCPIHESERRFINYDH